MAYYSDYKNVGVHHEPCFSLCDLANACGLNVSTIRTRFKASDYKPEPVWYQNSTCRRKRFYKLSELMQWVETYNNLHPNKAIVMEDK